MKGGKLLFLLLVSCRRSCDPSRVELQLQTFRRDNLVEDKKFVGNQITQRDVLILPLTLCYGCSVQRGLNTGKTAQTQEGKSGG